MRTMVRHIGKTTLSAIICTTLSPMIIAEEFPLEEIIITAQKRPQTLQDVPLSVSAVDGNFIADAAITEIAGLGEFVPNLQTSASPFNSVITIPGLGSGGANRAFEQSVAMFVDGTYAGRANQFLTPFFDVERIEVVRGPQGVLFGKNAIAGGVSVVSANPTEEFEAKVKASYEFENEGHTLETVVSGPLGDTVMARLAAKATREGSYLEKTTTGKDDGQIDSYVIRGILEWHASDSMTIGLKLETAQRDQEGNLFQISEIPADGATAALFGLVGGDNTERLDDKRSANVDEFINIETGNMALNVEYVMDAGTLTWVSSYSDYDFDQRLDADMSSLAFVTLTSTEEFEQFSQEIRFTSELGNAFDYIVGANYLDQTLDLAHGFDFNFPVLNPLLLAGGATVLPPFGVSPMWQFDQDTSSWSVFGELTWHVQDDIHIALGLRYTEEEKEASLATTVSTLGAPISDDPMARAVLAGSPLGWTPAPFMEDKRDEENLDSSIKVQWELDSDIQVYASLSKATKAGGFDSQNANGVLSDFSFDEEEVKSVELGTKMQLAGGSAQLNMAIFHTEFTDLQVSSFDGALFVIGNAAEATIDGFEADGRWRLSEALTVGGALAYLEAEYDDFPGFACITTPIGVPSSCDPATNNGKGSQLVFAPEWSGNIWAEYTQTVFNDWKLQSRIGANYSDDVSMGQDVDPLDI